jgi:hypothetical protein
MVRLELNGRGSAVSGQLANHRIPRMRRQIICVRHLSCDED